jgi:hypothetical protein
MKGLANRTSRHHDEASARNTLNRETAFHTISAQLAQLFFHTAAFAFRPAPQANAGRGGGIWEQARKLGKAHVLYGDSLCTSMHACGALERRRQKELDHGNIMTKKYSNSIFSRLAKTNRLSQWRISRSLSPPPLECSVGNRLYRRRPRLAPAGRFLSDPTSPGQTCSPSDQSFR